eukprot:Hpha_TRINITY_DN2164_c0_g1::TRINITY_DN2164_c0_g1_i2::g.42347::m.42347
MAVGCPAPPCSSTDAEGRTVVNEEAAPRRLWIRCPSVPWAAGCFVLREEREGRPVWWSACGRKRLFASAKGRWLVGAPEHVPLDTGCVQSRPCKHPIGPHHISDPWVRSKADEAARVRRVRGLFRSFDWDCDGMLNESEAERLCR